MVVYSLSPGAYEGLLEVASSTSFCSDYNRILRYLDVVVSLREAKLVPGDAKYLPDSCMGWKLLAFPEAAEHVAIRHRFR